MNYSSALIVGAGSGLSASLARAFAKIGMKVALAARPVEKLEPLARETKATIFVCDATDTPTSKNSLSILTAQRQRLTSLYLTPATAHEDHWPTRSARGEIYSGIRFQGFLVAQAAVRRMLPRKRVRSSLPRISQCEGYAQSAPFAMGKFAARPGAEHGSRICTAEFTLPIL
jgi:NAD(P)-dependent dehydrogenase (short-subunit alcohol dehydrogenase family)